MRIINVLEIINGIPNSIESFPIYEEQLSEDVVEQAENLFIQKINENIYPEVLSDEKQEFYLDEGNYDDMNGYKNIIKDLCILLVKELITIH